MNSLAVLRFLRRSAAAVTAGVVLITANGCSSGLGLWPVAQSHFAAAEMKIVPLGETEGTAGDFFFTWGGLPDFLHSDLQEEAVRKAIRAKGGGSALKLRDGNLLIDTKITTALTTYLGLYYRTVLMIDATAARVAGGRPGSDPRPRGFDS